MKPESYRIQNGCINCKHVFVLVEYDEGNGYFCHEDKSERPKCGSVYMKESWADKSDKVYEESWDKWLEWAEPREVEPNGICDKHERKDN